MEKQPVDDLFARKLRDADVAPGADVFGRLQSRMNSTPLPVAQPKRRLAGWWYGAAASLLLGILWLSWPRNSGTDKPTLTGHDVAQQSAVTPSRPSARKNELPRPKAQSALPADKASPEVTRLAERKSRRVKADEYVATKEATDHESITAEPATGQAKTPDNVPAIVAVDAPVIAKVEKSSSTTTEQKKSPMGRTVVLTIAEPAPAKLAVLEPTKPDAAPNAPNLTQFFDKVKQIKSGEVFARATPTRQTAEPKTGLGRLMNGVRESLRNENSLEP